MTYLAPPPPPTPTPETIREPIRVAVDFLPAVGQGQPKIRPLAFVWGRKKYLVKKLNLVYKQQQGRRFVWCFAVSDQANSFTLHYDPENLSWTLEEVYEL